MVLLGLVLLRLVKFWQLWKGQLRSVVDWFVALSLGSYGKVRSVRARYVWVSLG